MNLNHEPDPLLLEVAWEVCNQVGGIYTVIRSKAPSMVANWGNRYCLIGPYVHHHMPAEFEPSDSKDDSFSKAANLLRTDYGVEVYYGTWLVSGRPKVVLINPYSVYPKLAEIKYTFWEAHGISTPDEDLINQVMAFGFVTKLFLQILTRKDISHQPILAHFHEWMAGTAIFDVKKENIPITTIFTTHATLLGRYLAMNDPNFYDNLRYVNWEQDAIRFNSLAQVSIERGAAQNSDVFTTVSDVTANECEVILGREPDLIMPNGLNIERFTTLYEFQNLHQKFKEKINQFVMAHFFPSYSFDLTKTLFFFTSGRFEYKNKGFDLTLEALARLNYRLKQARIDKYVVMFFITKQPYHSINPGALHQRAVMEEIRDTCDEILKQVGEQLFFAAACNPSRTLPNLNDFVDDYWKLRLKRTLQSWKADYLPMIITHNLINDQDDPILNYLRTSNLLNYEHDKVKVVYHPDFISPINPLFGMEYWQFVRGCNMGIFPSYYEPWGYTPVECLASGIPAVTSDLSGFGDYVLKNYPNPEDEGIFVVKRRNRSFDEAADQLAAYMFKFVKQSRRERINQRNKSENTSNHFDWLNLISYYQKAYKLAMKKMQSRNVRV
jgi:glycogen synthase